MAASQAPGPQVGNMNASPSPQSPARLLALRHRAVWEGGRQDARCLLPIQHGRKGGEVVRGLAGTVPQPLAPLDLTLIPPAQPLPGSIGKTGGGPAASPVCPHRVKRAWGVQLHRVPGAWDAQDDSDAAPPQGLMVVCASQAVTATFHLSVCLTPRALGRPCQGREGQEGASENAALAEALAEALCTQGLWDPWGVPPLPSTWSSSA